MINVIKFLLNGMTIKSCRIPYNPLNKIKRKQKIVKKKKNQIQKDKKNQIQKNKKNQIQKDKKNQIQKDKK